MTEQSKIPLPGEPAAPSASRPPSSVERAIAGFDLSRLGGIATPLPPEAQRRVVMREVTIEPAHVPVPAAEATPAPLAETVAAPIVPAPAPVAAAQPAITARPVRFGETRHPVDRAHLRNSGLIVPEGSVTALLEEFRIVKRQLLLHSAQLRASLGAAAQRVLVCSPLPGEGKTYCATNLALAIAAEKESEVVLVDADFAKPSVLSALGLPGGPGLMDALSDPAVDVAECVIGTDIPGLWVLPAGNATTSDTEYLASSRTRADSPPALAASPAAELAKYVGQALVVCRADRTGQSSLEDAIALLSGCPNIQLLLNAVQFSPSGRRFGSYYGYTG
jgi:Mrp family chromosome partitioning ATPase